MTLPHPPSDRPGDQDWRGAARAVRPVRLQLSRKKGFDLVAHSRAVNGLPAVNCARPGILGNPFVHETDPAQAVEAFDRLCRGGTQSFDCSPNGLHFAERIHANSLHCAWSEWLRDKGVLAMRGRNLACWCSLCPAHAATGKPLDTDCPDCAPCHVNVLGRIVCEPIPTPTGEDGAVPHLTTETSR